MTATGADTVYGGLGYRGSERKRGFDKGANSIARVLLKFMVILVPVVFLAGGLTQGDWINAFVFALSVAVGLTPELLPMVVNACLARGSYSMGQKQTVVKDINAMQGFGSMDVLCVDKTGTLTTDTVQLEYYTDILGNESVKALDSSSIRWLCENLPDSELRSGVVRLGCGEYDSLIVESAGTFGEFSSETRCGTLIVNEKTRCVEQDGKVVSLTPKEYDILLFLIHNRGEVFTKEQIYKAVWDDDYVMDDSNIMAFIRKLRKKIEPNPDNPEYILTIWGIGYKFNDRI